MGYLHHSRYFEYFEMGRTELLRQIGVSYRECEARGVFFVVTKLQCRFLAPARYDDVLSLTTTTARVTRARMDHEYRLTCDGRLLCEASSTIACVDRQGQPQAIPEFIGLSMGAASRADASAERGAATAEASAGGAHDPA
jgi:acyl-CoA thioester hydrolase